MPSTVGRPDRDSHSNASTLPELRHRQNATPSDKKSDAPADDMTVPTETRWLVMLHGMMGNVSNWNSTRDYFSDTYRVLPVAFPLFETDSPYHNVDTLTDFVEKRMSQRGIRDSVIFGNSMGGQIALQYAIRHPARVAGLVLTGSAGLLERGMASQAPLKPSRAWIRDRVRELFYDDVHVTEELVDEVLDILSTNRNKLRLVKLARALREKTMEEDLPTIKVPTLLVWGRDDTVTPVEVGQMFADCMPNARLHVLDECGHAPNIEQPDRFNALAETFLEEIGYR